MFFFAEYFYHGTGRRSARVFTSADAPLANGSQLPAASGRQVVDSGDWSGLCSARWKTADADADLL